MLLHRHAHCQGFLQRYPSIFGFVPLLRRHVPPWARGSECSHSMVSANWPIAPGFPRCWGYPLSITDILPELNFSTYVWSDYRLDSGSEKLHRLSACISQSLFYHPDHGSSCQDQFPARPNKCVRSYRVCAPRNPDKLLFPTL